MVNRLEPYDTKPLEFASTWRIWESSFDHLFARSIFIVLISLLGTRMIHFACTRFHLQGRYLQLCASFPEIPKFVSVRIRYLDSFVILNTVHTPLYLPKWRKLACTPLWPNCVCVSFSTVN